MSASAASSRRFLSSAIVGPVTVTQSFETPIQTKNASSAG
jgi:hypothetical protein